MPYEISFIFNLKFRKDSAKIVVCCGGDWRFKDQNEFIKSMKTVYNLIWVYIVFKKMV